MALLVTNVRQELAESREAQAAAEQAAGEMAALIAQEHERARKAEEELRLAWAQVPMVEQSDLSPGKPSIAQKAKRALKR